MADDSIFKALADPTRREILRLLARREMTAGELADQFEVSKPSMSHHFAVLKQAELIRGRRARQQIFYSLKIPVVQEVLAWALHLAERGRKGGRSDARSALGSRRAADGSDVDGVARAV
jgi:DNA-binding transcriptional ArsR family regulator